MVSTRWSAIPAKSSSVLGADHDKGADANSDQVDVVMAGLPLRAELQVERSALHDAHPIADARIGAGPHANVEVDRGFDVATFQGGVLGVPEFEHRRRPVPAGYRRRGQHQGFDPLRHGLHELQCYQAAERRTDHSGACETEGVEDLDDVVNV